MAKKILVVVAVLILLHSPLFAEDRFFSSNGVRIRYVDEGVGVPIILLHGFAGSIDHWQVDTQIFQTLLNDYRVIAFDSRGNGKSGKPHNKEAFGIEMVRDALRLLDHLKIQRAHFVGFSFGGIVVAKLLTMNPERFLTATIGGTAGRRSEGSVQIAPDSAPRIKVFVRAGQPEDRFVDPTIRDSAADLAGYLKIQKSIQLVGGNPKAQIEIRVLRRFISNPGGVGAASQNVGTTLAVQSHNLVAILLVQGYRHQLTGQHQSVTGHDSVWRAAARDLANQIDRWITENRSRLLEH